MGFKRNVERHMKAANEAIENLIKTNDGLMQVLKIQGERISWLADRVSDLEREGVPSHTGEDS